jgi:DnaD/phage-associated family protein
VLETSPEIDYNTEELTRLLEKKKITSEFIDEAQKIFGKSFNAYDSAIAAGLIDRLGFEPEAVLAILAYCAERDKRTMRYVEKIALSFYDEGITTSDAVYDKIRNIEKNALIVEQIKKLFGIGDRALSSTEKKLFENWTSEYAFDMEIIRRAYDITIDYVHQPDPKYTNGVLTKWYEAGVKTTDDIDKYEEQRKADYEAVKAKPARTRKKAEPEREKSYDIDAFFEASLARGFEESDKNT